MLGRDGQLHFELSGLPPFGLAELPGSTTFALLLLPGPLQAIFKVQGVWDETCLIEARGDHWWTGGHLAKETGVACTQKARRRGGGFSLLAVELHILWSGPFFPTTSWKGFDLSHARASPMGGSSKGPDRTKHGSPAPNLGQVRIAPALSHAFTQPVVFVRQKEAA
jgi:hypothetical protein